MSEKDPTISTTTHVSEYRLSVPTAVAELKKRTIDGSVCGWLGGRAELPAICSADTICVHDTQHKYVGCCAKSDSCTAGIYTSCVDRNNSEWSPPPSIQPNGAYYCPADLECYRNTYADGYVQYGCGKSSWATHVESTYMGQQSGVTLQHIYTAVTFSETATVLSTSQIIETSTTALVSTPTDTSLPSPSLPVETEEPGKRRLAPGAIAGIVIFNCLALLTGLAFCFWLRRRKQRRRPIRNSYRKRKTASKSAERLSAMSQVPNVLPTPLLISSTLFPYRSPHTSSHSSSNQPSRLMTHNQTTPLVNPSLDMTEISREFGESLSQTDNLQASPLRSRPQLSAGFNDSPDRLTLMQPTSLVRSTLRSIDHSDDDLDYHSISGELTESQHSQISAAEEVTPTVSFLSEREREELLSIASIQHMKHVRRSTNGRYHLVDQTVNSEESSDSMNLAGVRNSPR